MHALAVECFLCRRVILSNCQNLSRIFISRNMLGAFDKLGNLQAVDGVATTTTLVVAELFCWFGLHG